MSLCNRSYPRTFLALLAVGGMTLLVTTPNSSHAQQVLRKMSNLEAASHALNRLAFGARPGQAADVARFGWESWVDQQLTPGSIDDKAVESLMAEKCPSLGMSVSRLQALERDDKDQENKQRIKRELVNSVILRAVYSNRQFQEVMVNFWRNHFNVDVNKVPFLATHYEENVLRKRAFGKFEDLLMATATHPAMLVYLDNYVSRSGRLNENYARELMELHTLGVDNGYTQQDVIALARVLTGWTCGWQDSSSGQVYAHYFNSGMHNTEPATVVGLQLDGTGGAADGEQAIRHLARHSGTAHFLAKKLCVYLVTDSPSKALVDRVAGVFLSTQGDLTQVYREIIMSREFRDANNYRSKFKTPFEFVIHVMRTTDAQIESCDQLSRSLRLMGQSTYECLEPTGYYDQAEAWLDPGVMVYRWNFAIQLVQEKVPGIKIGREFSDAVLHPQLSAQVHQVMQMTLPGVSDPATEKMLGQTKDIRGMVALAIGSPAYQQQ